MRAITHNAYYVNLTCYVLKSLPCRDRGVYVARMTPTPPPIDDDRDLTGGGTPNRGALEVIGHPISRGSPFVQTVAAVSETLAREAPVVDEPDSDELPVRWNGEPSKAALRRLALASRVPAFDAEQAALVLTGLWEGRTLRSLCRSPGYPSRAVVMGWAALVPKFAEMLEAAQVALGAEMRDRAVEAASGEPSVDECGNVVAARDPDGAVARAWLAIATAFDRRIAKGAEEPGPQVGVQVVLQRDFGR